MMLILILLQSVFGKGKENIIDWINNDRATFINKEKASEYLHHSETDSVTSNNPETSSTKVEKETVKEKVKNFENKSNLFRVAFIYLLPHHPISSSHSLII